MEFANLTAQNAYNMIKMEIYLLVAVYLLSLLMSVLLIKQSQSILIKTMRYILAFAKFLIVQLVPLHLLFVVLAQLVIIFQDRPV